MLNISKTLDLPADIATKASAILGIRGSGKTNTGVVIVEGLLDESRPVVVIDPLDVWWGLRSTANGDRAGFKVVVCGGEHGDLPLTEDDGATLADFVVEHQVPLVLSLRHLRKGAQQRFVTAFSEQLYHRKGEAKHRVPLLVVIDEADSFVPQRVGGNEARMVGAIEDLVRRGRSAGIGVLMISQRAASINKDVLTQIELMIAHRHTSPQDRSALKAWIDANDDADHQRDFLAQLSSLKLGEAWFWSPGWLKLFQHVKVRARNTFDSSGTPDSAGASATPKRFADVDLEAIRGKLAKTIELSKADDPKELKKRIAELTRQVKVAPVDKEAIDKAVFLAVERRDQEWLKSIRERDGLIDSLKGRMTKAADLLHVNGEATLKTEAPAKAFTSQGKTYTTVAPKTVYQPRQENPQSGGLSRMERAFLTVLAQHPDGLTKRQILTHTDYASSGPVSTLFAKMVRDGWVDEPAASSLRITPAGLTALGPFEPLPKGAELRELRLSSPKLSPMEKAILGCLFGNYPNGITKREILGATGYKSSGPVSTTFAKFVRLGWAQQHGRSALKAADVFFE